MPVGRIVDEPPSESGESLAEAGRTLSLAEANRSRLEGLSRREERRGAGRTPPGWSEGDQPAQDAERTRRRRRDALPAFRPPRLIVIGASAGGPVALTKILAALPADLPVPIVVVQHMPEVFTRLFADRLDGLSALEVREAAGGDRLLPGTVRFAPGNFHVGVRNVGGELLLEVHQSAPENFCRPSVDVLFRSAAKACGGAVLGVILTGMGSDGLRGSESIRAAGGQVIVQDEATSAVWGMPGAVAKAGFASSIVPLDNMSWEIVRRVTGSAEDRPPAAEGT